MKTNLEIRQILDLMKEKSRFLITSHRDPDGDSIGSQLGLCRALRDSGKEALVVNHGAIPEKYAFLNSENIIVFENKPLPFIPEVVFVLECPLLERIGFVEDLIPESAEVVNIDHHLDNARYGDINLVDSKSCAVGELIYYILDEGKYEFTPEIAEDLYAAMICDTGNFKFASTTARGMRVAARLVEYGANPKSIYDRIYSNASPATVRLLGYTLATLKTAADGRISYMTVSRENAERAQARMEDSEGFVDYCTIVAGVRMGMLFKEMGDSEVKISIRSQNGVDAATFARRFNGGGHFNAAGFTIHGMLFDVIGDVVRKAEEYVREN
jgi:phosphoesterase RecJ-like protein